MERNSTIGKLAIIEILIDVHVDMLVDPKDSNQLAYAVHMIEKLRALHKSIIQEAEIKRRKANV